jgi:carbonic anhydrase
MRHVLLVVVALIWPLPAAAQHGAKPHWEYEGEHGPAHWGTLDPAYHTCVAGTHQSPIDIRDARSGDLPAISFSYHPTALKLIDNGHTIQVNYAPGSFISVAGKQYELLQFHFHHPAEEQVSGTSYPMVAHLVHKSADGKLAVVAVLLAQGGAANDFIERLWKHLPAEQGKEIAVQGVALDVSTLLPATHGYFTYAGSLTTPPCTEGVTWFVLKTPVQISQNEIAAFAKKYPHNARPIQQLHGRVIQATK